jgi:hypothetical protein
MHSFNDNKSSYSSLITPPGLAAVSPSFSIPNPVSTSQLSGAFSPVYPLLKSSLKAHPTETAVMRPASTSLPAGEVVGKVIPLCLVPAKRPSVTGAQQSLIASLLSPPPRTLHWQRRLAKAK